MLSLILKAPTAVKDGSSTNDTEAKPATSKRRRSARPKLLKRYTFQEKSANTYAVNSFEYDLAGEVLLSPTSSANFAFQTEAEATSPDPTEFNIDFSSEI